VGSVNSQLVIFVIFTTRQNLKIRISAYIDYYILTELYSSVEKLWKQIENETSEFYIFDESFPAATQNYGFE
jgi:hypothetical protein